MTPETDERWPETTDLACRAAIGSGGFGRHALEIVLDLERAGRLGEIWSPGGHERASGGIPSARTASLLGLRLLRPARRVRAQLNNLAVDRTVARRLRGRDLRQRAFLSFAGHARTSLATARRDGARTYLMAANSHVDNVRQRHRDALSLHPIERSWLTRFEHERTLREYRLADTIVVASDYSRATFESRSAGSATIESFPMHPHERFQPGPASNTDTFTVAYTGALTVPKGVPTLVEAVRSLPFDDLRLVLVGGPSSPGMRQYLEEAVTADPRVEVRPGDPLPVLRDARLYVHPSWEEGFGYGPAEAWACGLPLALTHDTGMQDVVGPDDSAQHFDAGDTQTLAGIIEAAHGTG